MHGHAHHNHERNVEELEPRGDVDERGNVVIVYKTMEPDFVGEIGGYRTGDQQTTEANTATQKAVGVGAAVGVHATTTKEQTAEAKATDDPTTTKAKEEATTTQHTEAKTTQETEAETTETTKAETTEKTEKSDTEASTTTTSQNPQKVVTVSSFVTSASQTSESSQYVDNILAATSSASATDSAASASNTALGSTTSEGMTGGAKAGVAIGVIFGVGVIAALIFFLIRKKKNKAQEGYQQENEKAFGGEGLPEGYASNLPPPPPAKPDTPSTPPVLNVRPVTQFAPDLSGGSGFKPAAAGAVGAAGFAAGSAAVASRNLTGDTPPATPPKPVVDSPNPFSDPVNPFGSATTPVTEHAPSIAESSTGPPGPTVAAAAVGTAAAGAAVGAAASSRQSSDRDSYESARSRGHSPTESNHSSTMPAYAEGITAAGAGAAAGPMIAGAGGPPPPNNVHRVQLDFNPSMEDELGLRSGSLVRLVHEYDDGWVSDNCNVTENHANPLYRLSASASMAHSKVWLLGLAYQHALLCLAHAPLQELAVHLSWALMDAQ
jgi:hypothetical protein